MLRNCIRKKKAILMNQAQAIKINRKDNVTIYVYKKLFPNEINKDTHDYTRILICEIMNT